jgi:ABC-type polar amino acid transport system ATPase subunit
MDYYYYKSRLASSHISPPTLTSHFKGVLPRGARRLDEAASSLDTLMEREVMQALNRLMAGRTTLVITHRLAGLEAMDEILVLDRGRVIQAGRHEKLLRQQGLYRRMGAMQQVIGI